MRKPIKVFYSEMSGRFYASSRYKEIQVSPNKIVFEITGEKFDVTDDIGYAVTHFKVEFYSNQTAGAGKVTCHPGAKD